MSTTPPPCPPTVPLIIIIHDSAAAHPAPAAGPTPSWEALGLRRQAPVGTTSMPTVPPADVCPADCGTHGRCVGGQCDCAWAVFGVPGKAKDEHSLKCFVEMHTFGLIFVRGNN